jgi:hypothetical protein
VILTFKAGEITDLGVVLRSAFDAWKKADPSRTQRMLAEMSGIRDTSLSRALSVNGFPIKWGFLLRALRAMGASAELRVRL